MAIDRNTVRHVARLARLALTAEEEERTAAQLGHVLEYIERLEAVDIKGIEPLSFAGDASEAEAVMRDDEIRPGLPREKVLAEAPEQDGSAFVVPRILE
ncbi:MAG TPA: Asp-tRNA(Asn)/Glu-tRNA(Gln) amidotransferase subunit GatC [Myxococcales bacterium]